MSIIIATSIADIVVAQWIDKFPDASERAWFRLGVALWVKSESDSFWKSRLVA